MDSRYYLGATDYAVLVFTLLISAAIGIIFRFSGGRQKTTTEYLLADRDMSQIPVTLSISVTITSAVMMLGTPAETYRYGLQHVVTPFGIVIGMLLASYVFIPVYFQCRVSTVYEFLDMRYGKYTRLIVSALFVVQTILYMSAVLYGPALALSAVTDLTLTTSILVIGGVCTFYCVLGGLKAVIWTDAFQAVLMFTCMIVFYTVSISDAGGISKIYERAYEGNRLELLK
ncbi:putative sodium-dependent multivitamin transporter [Parasteatoda tepidariorum]|uniref:putative sodium-dependent multivitamin transporter n=1 Tax=Parasteatoda tepidariorum TaxID=114398 RepID=UPI001C71EA04|nr:putative sodium-dependent multivitamin transporter [Parasteatoda tepidariorum]